MKKRFLKIFLLIFFIQNGYSQEYQEVLFQNDFSYFNPAYIGMFEKNNATFYTSEFHGNMFNDFFNFSYGRLALAFPVEKLYSVVGINVNHNRSIYYYNQKFGFNYCVKYNINDDLKFALGTDISLNKARMKYEEYTVDGEYNSLDAKAYLKNIDLGLWIKIYNLNLGFAYYHLNNPTTEYFYVDVRQDYNYYSLPDYFRYIISYDFKIGKMSSLRNTLMIRSYDFTSDYKYIDMNNIYSFKNKYLLGLTSKIYIGTNSTYGFFPNIGINLSDKFMFLTAFNLIELPNNPKPYYYRSYNIQSILTYRFD